MDQGLFFFSFLDSDASQVAMIAIDVNIKHCRMALRHLGGDLDPGHNTTFSGNKHMDRNRDTGCCRDIDPEMALVRPSCR